MRSGWPHPGRVASIADRAGIGDESTVVVYDDTQGLYAARVWWTFLAYGAEHVRILDGGYPAWEAEDRPIERGPGNEAPYPTRRSHRAARTACISRHPTCAGCSGHPT